MDMPSWAELQNQARERRERERCERQENLRAHLARQNDPRPVRCPYCDGWHGAICPAERGDCMEEARRERSGGNGGWTR